MARPELMHPNSSFHLTLIGRGHLDLPPELAGKATVKSNLNYAVSLVVHLSVEDQVPRQ